MAGESSSWSDLARKFFLRGMTTTDADGNQTDATDNAAGGGVLVTSVSSSGVAQTINSDGSAFVQNVPREAGLHNYATATSVAAGVVIATVTPTVAGVYEVTASVRMSTGSAGETVSDNAGIFVNAVEMGRILTSPLPTFAMSEVITLRILVNWTTGPIDIRGIATSASTSVTYRGSIAVKRVS